ncbi:hypothetical protein OS187_12530 [Xanthomonadaceae bacterium JHOS43]|nr:hypothetical protein [Xanthomonadaceae bacterium JHOS43]
MPPFDSLCLVWRRLRHPVGLAVVVLLGWFLLDSILYRSGFYYRFLAEPHSNAGAAMLRPLLARRNATEVPPTVLVFGDSRVGQGFSPPTAASVVSDVTFVNVAVPGSTARTWYYLLRKMVRDEVPFDVVVVGVPYQPTGAARWVDWSLDPAFMASLTDLRDAREFPASFEDPDIRRRARHAFWLPALQMQQDTQALFASPRERWRSLRGKRWWLAHVDDYPGEDAHMPALEFDGNRQVRDWSRATAEQRAALEQHLQILSQEPAADNEAFLGHWLGRLLGLVRGNGARLIIFPLPRGPYPEILPRDNVPSAALSALAQEPDVTLLPADFLADLEAPGYFFDALHANSTARAIVSRRLAAAVAEVMAADGIRSDASQP